jgi:hypothetical protein
MHNYVYEHVLNIMKIRILFIAKLKVYISGHDNASFWYGHQVGDPF